MIHNPFLIALCVIGVCLFAPVFAWWVSGPLARIVDAVIDVVQMVWYDFVLDKPLLITHEGVIEDKEWLDRLADARESHVAFLRAQPDHVDESKAVLSQPAEEAKIAGSLSTGSGLPQGSAKARKKGATRGGAKKIAPKTSKKRGRTK